MTIQEQFSVEHKRSLGLKSVDFGDIDDDVRVKDLETRSIQKEGYLKLKDVKNCILSAPTGCGKSVLMVSLIANKLSRDENLRAIISIPQRNIAKGFYNNKIKLPKDKSGKRCKLGKFAPAPEKDDHDVHLTILNLPENETTKEIIEFLKKPFNAKRFETRVRVCTHSTLVSVFKKLKKKKQTKLLNNLIVWLDEAHHLNISSTEQEEDEEQGEFYFGDETNEVGKFIVHCLSQSKNTSINLATATFFRGDRKSVLAEKYYNLFERYSVPMDVYLKETGINLSFNYIIDTKSPEKIVENLYKEKDSKTIIYLPDVHSHYQVHNKYEQVKRIEKSIKKVNKGAVVVDVVRESGRKEKFVNFDGAKTDVVCALKTCREGWDWVEAERAIVIGPRGSIVEVNQILGRLLRQHEDKNFVEMFITLPFKFEQLKPKEFQENLNEYQKCIYLSLIIEDIINPIKIKAPRNKGGNGGVPSRKNHITLADIIPSEEKRKKIIDEIGERSCNFSVKYAEEKNSKELLLAELPFIVKDVLGAHDVDEEHVDSIVSWVKAIWNKRNLRLRGQNYKHVKVDLISKMDHPLAFLLYSTGVNSWREFKELKDAANDSTLLTDHPRWHECLKDEWDYEENTRLGIELEGLLSGSGVKAAWVCGEGHKWRAIVGDRSDGTGCPFCANRVKLTIEECREYAKSKGGKCLSKEYIDSRTKMKWQCKEGHIWKANFNSIKSGKWCPYCANCAKLTIEDCQEYAKSKGGKCLSKEYVNSQTKIEWQCKEGHIWKANFNKVKSGRWCPFCANRVPKKYTFNGLSLGLSQWSQILKINRDTLRSRINTYGWSIEEAFTTPG